MQPHRMILALFAFVALAVPAAAQEPADSARVAELERQVEAITRELESLRLGRDVVQADTSVLGFGPAASRIYRVDQGVSLGGYGEVLYENFSSERENGVGAFGGNDAFSWRVYLMNSLNGEGFGASGLRGGRQKGAQALAEDLGVPRRLARSPLPDLLWCSGSRLAGIVSSGDRKLRLHP